MDRYIIKEPRVGADYPQRNQLGFSPNTGNNSIMIETMYFGGFGAEFPNNQPIPAYNMGMSTMNAFPPGASNMQPAQTQSSMVSGIDPRYLAAYADGNASFISGLTPQMPISSTMTYSNEYQNRSFSGVDRHKLKNITPSPQTSVMPFPSTSNTTRPREPQKNFQGNRQMAVSEKKADLQTQVTNPAQAFFMNEDTAKMESKSPAKLRAEKLKVLQKSGPRVFSGSVEKVLKWHKALQDTGILVLYEVVAKCVSVRPGESCAKNLVIRDDSGPAMQVVYYEIDFLLSELKPPCTIRVIGRIMPGTCRLQAFNVRPATGDDVATLSRRAAVASHHVSKICKEMGIVI